MSNKYQSRTLAMSATIRYCDKRHVGHVMLALLLAACLVVGTHCSQLKLLVNDDDLMLQQERHYAASIQQMQPDETAGGHGPRGFGAYRSELQRLSYETIHRILRDENEPIFRREDSDFKYYQKRSSQPHTVLKRSLPTEAPKPLVLVSLGGKELRDFSTAAVKLTEDPSRVTAIDLHDNVLERVDLEGFPSLISLNLTNNTLSDLPDLTTVPQLATLHMNGNRVRDVRPQTNFHLRELHLSGNAIANLSSVQLSTLNALETLDLSCNGISSLETSFFPQRMHNLKHLNLAHNAVGSIYRETFYNLLSLNTLLLAHNNISAIDYETFLALPNLQNLDLSYNNLRGDAIRALQGIPDLVRLSIAYNPQVGALMQEFVASWSLKELDASGTGLCQIPAALAQSVRMLKLTDNWLKVINCGDLDSYPLLQYLDLSRSRIEDIEDDALGRLEILESLFLDHNLLAKVPLSLPTSLEHLFLQHNQIQDIAELAFQGLGNLQTLDLSGNKLLYLPALQLPKLVTLNLQAAELKGLSQSIVHTMPHLRDLWLDDNPIKCSDLLGIAEWASPCRPVAEIDDGELGQSVTRQGGKIDLKRTFLRMHNFYENFMKNATFCQQQQQHHDQQQQQRQRQMMVPPACAREFNDHVASPSSPRVPTTAAPLAEAISSTNPSTIMLMMKNVATQQLPAADNQINLSKTFAANKQTAPATQQSLTNANMMERHATNNTQMPATDKIKEQELPKSPQKLQENPQAYTERMQRQPDELRQRDIVSVSGTTAKSPLAMASLNFDGKLSTERDDDTADTTNLILKPTPLTPTTTTTTTTEFDASQMDSNLDLAAKGLLSKKWLKLSKTLKRQSPTATATAAPTTTTTKVMASVKNETPTTGQRLQSMATPQPEENLATAAVSGRATPTNATTTPHHHNSLQLHIKDRHLIGTPLLMHKGENILVEAQMLPKSNALESLAATAAEHMAGNAVTTTTGTTTTISMTLPHERRLKGHDINVLAESQQQQQHEHETTTTHPIKPLTNDDVTRKHTADRITKPKAERKEHLKKPSLIMKKMTITKMHPTPAQAHYTLNTPHENEPLTAHEFVSESNGPPRVELKPHQATVHGSVNTARQQERPPMGSSKSPGIDHVPNTLQHVQETPSKTEHLMDVRKGAPTTGHPGLVLLLSFSLFVVLLVGLMHVYRCDMPWRRHLNGHHQRPHRHALNAEDDSHSFLSYQQNSSTSQQPAIQQWHHSLRDQKPFQSPLHHLHVRELQQISAVDDRHHQRRPQTIGLYGGAAAAATSTTSSRASDGGSASHSSNSSPGSHSLSGSEHFEANETFYIEMTTEPGQHALHSDMLPMELLSVSTAPRQKADNESRPCDSGQQMDEPQRASQIDGIHEPMDEQQPTQKRSARKFGLW